MLALFWFLAVCVAIVRFRRRPAPSPLPPMVNQWNDLFDREAPLQEGEEVWVATASGAIRAHVTAIKNGRIALKDCFGTDRVAPRELVMSYPKEKAA